MKGAGIANAIPALGYERGAAATIIVTAAPPELPASVVPAAKTGPTVGAPVDADATFVPLIGATVGVSVGAPGHVLGSRHSRVVESGVELEVTGYAFGLVARLEAKVRSPVAVSVPEACRLGPGVVGVRTGRDNPDTSLLGARRAIELFAIAVKKTCVVVDVLGSRSRGAKHLHVVAVGAEAIRVWVDVVICGCGSRVGVDVGTCPAVTRTMATAAPAVIGVCCGDRAGEEHRGGKADKEASCCRASHCKYLPFIGGGVGVTTRIGVKTRAL